MGWFRKKPPPIREPVNPQENPPNPPPPAGMPRPMPFPDAFAAVHRRVDHLVRAHDLGLTTGAPDLVADRATMLVEAGRLWEAAQPADPDWATDPAAATDDELDRLKAARHLIGWLHAVRFHQRTTAADLAELAQSVLLLVPFALSDPATLPEHLDALIGPAGEPDTQTIVAEGFLDLGHRYGDPALPSAAIELLIRAVAGTEVRHPDRAVRLRALSAAYLRRAEFTWSAEDVEASVVHGEHALAAARAAGLPDLLDYQAQTEAARRFSLPVASSAANRRPVDPGAEFVFTAEGAADRRGIAADLDQALAQARRQLADVPLDPFDQARRRALGHLDDYARDGLAVSLEAGLRILAELVPAAPPDREPELLGSLGMAHLTRFARTATVDDLDLGIAHLERALALIGNLEPGRFGLLEQLVLGYRQRFEERGVPVAPDRLEQLIQRTHDFWGSQSSYPVKALTEIGRLAQLTGADRIAVTAFDQAIERLPSIARRSLAWADKEHELAAHTGLVRDAIAAHLSVNDVEKALLTAESGRGLMLAAQLELRTELTELRRVRPDLADRFELVGTEIDDAEPSSDRSRHTGEARGWQRERDWVGLLTEIRELAGFARFLAPPTVAELRSADPGQDVVLMNVAAHRADAIVIPAGGAAVHAVALDRLTLADVQRHASELARSDVDGWSQDAGLTLPETLTWLWDSAVEPVLTVLGHTRHPTTGNWPRLCWVPTGLLTLLPLHAAGRPDGPNALDRVISSYSPTIRMLKQAREKPDCGRRGLSIALPHTPGQPDLPGSADEAKSLAERPGTAALIDSDATTERALTALSTASWLHFAGHAESDAIVPSRSGLLLHDGLLPVLRIAALHLQNAEIAYLSACSTARPGWLNADEPFTLAAAFQVAGYRHVIATLWPLDDEVAAQAAHRFYQLLADAPTAEPSAGALNRLTRELRLRYPDHPQAWAPLIHAGP